MNINFSNLPNGYPQLVLLVTLASYVFWAIINIIFSIVVYKDSSKIHTSLVNPYIWTAVTLFGGPVFAGVYWVVNRLELKKVEKLIPKQPPSSKIF